MRTLLPLCGWPPVRGVAPPVSDPSLLFAGPAFQSNSDVAAKVRGTVETLEGALQALSQRIEQSLTPEDRAAAAKEKEQERLLRDENVQVGRGRFSLLSGPQIHGRRRGGAPGVQILVRATDSWQE